MKAATKILAEFVSQLNYRDLSPKTIRKTKQCILDWLGVCIRGSQEKPVQIIRQVLPPSQAREASILAGCRTKTSALDAAFCNGAASHSLDFDDLHNASIIHLATVVIPPVFALGEEEHLPGQEMLAAIAAGYEIGARVGETVNPESYYFWHTTGTAGTIGAGAAAARALKLSGQETLMCLGSAGTQAAGLWEFLEEGAMSKPLHTGKGAYAGVLSAFLARAGFSGASHILEGPKGFCLAMTPTAKLEKLLADLPQLGSKLPNTAKHFKIEENSFKPYPCCKHSHAGIYALQLLKQQEHFAAGQIASLKLLVNHVTKILIDNPAPQTVYGCKFSLQYLAACALKYGEVGLAQFVPDIRESAEIRSLMKKITVTEDAQVQALYAADPTKLATKVQLTLTDGRTLEKLIEYPKGDPQNPMTWDESVHKFQALAQPIYGKECTDKLCTLIDDLDTVLDFTSALDTALAPSWRI